MTPKTIDDLRLLSERITETVERPLTRTITISVRDAKCCALALEFLANDAALNVGMSDHCRDAAIRQDDI